jgi:N-glycosylase/DNA lyase
MEVVPKKISTIRYIGRIRTQSVKVGGVITEIPKTLSKGKYFELEKKMQNFSDKTGIPIAHLDLLFWYKEAGEIFK